MTTMQEIKEVKRKLAEEIARYVFEHPDVSYYKVGEMFGVSFSTVSRVATSVGKMAPRKAGRKPKAVQS